MSQENLIRQQNLFRDTTRKKCYHIYLFMVDLFQCDKLQYYINIISYTVFNAKSFFIVLFPFY